MDSERYINTVSLFLFGSLNILHGIVEFGMEAKESRIALLKTSSILFPLTILIGIATNQIFKDLDWPKTSSIRFLTGTLFTLISSISLASAAAIGFGFTNSLEIGPKVFIVAAPILCGICLIVNGLSNIYLDTDFCL